MFEPFAFDPTAFMSGQVISKLWLCEELEPILRERFEHAPDVWILGGWYGMTSFLLQSREAHVVHVTSFDADPQATAGARVYNEAFLHLNTFQAVTQDVHTLDYSASPDVIINTSAEHMPDRSWFSAIPAGKLVVIQTNNMPHDDHVFAHQCVEELEKEFPLSTKIFAGDLPFYYDDWSFKRFMLIGIK